MPRSLCVLAAILAYAPSARAVDLEAFEFDDPAGTQITAAANSANPGNTWFYDEDATTPGDETTGDVSEVASGVYELRTISDFDTGLESRFLDIANVSTGQVYLSATFASWDFGSAEIDVEEEVRFTFLNDDTGTSGSTVTAQMQVRRNAATGSMELFGDAIGTAGSFDIARTVDLPNVLNESFTMVLGVDLDSDSFEVFYKQGSAPSQALGLGGISRARDANSVRFVTNDYGLNSIPPFLFSDTADVDRIAVSDDNPLDDLITLEVDRDTGAVTLVNTSGASVSGVTGVTIESATGAFNASDFVDFSGTLTAGQSVSLDASAGPGPWLQNPVEDLRAELATASGVRTVDVDFVGNGGVKWEIGDLDFDGVIDADDYLVLTASAESDLSSLTLAEAYQVGDLNGDGANDVGDFGLFKNAFIAANGAPAFANLIAGVPEPAGAGLVLAGLAIFGTLTGERRRFGRTQRLACLAALLVLGVQRPAHAVIFEDFLFNDPEGTLLTGVANDANPGNLFDEDGDTIEVATNGLGQLNASLKDNTDFGTNYVDIEPGLTTGTVYGVMELTWDFQSVFDPAEPEQLRISLTNNDPRGTQITGEFRIARTAGGVIINGMAAGTGSSDLPDTLLNGGSLTQTDKFIAVVAADLDASTYEVLYSSNGGASFLSAGTGNSSPGRIAEAMRLTLNNDLSGDNVLIDRVYLADELPIMVDPDQLTLLVHPLSGATIILNDTISSFEIDHYRITSGDGSLTPGGWVSLADQQTDAVDGPDGGSTPGDGVGETWTEAGGSDASVLSESFLLGSSEFGPGDALPIGSAFDLDGDSGQLAFEYRDAATGGVFEGVVMIAEDTAGDFNLDGEVDGADYVVWRNNATGRFTAGDLDTWKANYGASRAVPTPASVLASVPEPLAAALALMACLAVSRKR